MSATANSSTTWFPLIPRPRPPGLPLQARVADLTTLAEQAEAGTAQQRATAAAEVLNKAALIASDCGIPALARELCHRQYTLLSQSGPLAGWAARLALQPVLNIVRQLIRDGYGDDASAMLEDLHAAALRRSAADIDGTRVDFATLTSTADGHKETCMLTWTALLADGTRALARAGRWRDAAERSSAHRGTGARLLDGRQAAILALLADGRAGEATQMVERTAVAEPWEHAVQAVLRVLCQRAAGQPPEPGIAAMITAASTLARQLDPATASSRARIGLAALETAGGGHTTQTHALRGALITAANSDSYIALDLLTHLAAWSLADAQRSQLQAVVQAGGLKAGTIPGHLHEQLMKATGSAEITLTQTANTARCFRQ